MRIVSLTSAIVLCALFFAAAEENVPEETRGAVAEDAVVAKMERGVEPAVWRAWREAHPAAFRLFGEERRFAVRNNIIPAHWFEAGSEAANIFRGAAQPGEWYAFQICVASEKARELEWDAETELAVTRVTPRKCRVAAGGVKPIWVMVDIPKDAAGKTFKGRVAVRDANARESAAMPFEIAVRGEVLEDGGVSDAWRLARLKWLNSDIGREETVVKPYAPVEVDRAARIVKILGRELVLGEDGLPEQIVSHFSGSNTRIEKDGMRLLGKPFEFAVSPCGGAAAGGGDFAFTDVSAARAKWKAATRRGAATVEVEGAIDFAGSAAFKVRVRGAGERVSAKLSFAMAEDVARFMDGFGRLGGELEDGADLVQTWNAEHCRDSLWLGRVNGGLAIRFKGANWRRPLINAYYKWRKINPPESWAAGGGTMRLAKSGGVATVEAKGENAPADAEWNFDLHLTPFHRLDMKTHLADRYFHPKQKIAKFDAGAIRRKGATVVNIHHNTLWNPYINYPFNDDGGALLGKIVREAHAAGLMLKPYYTTRELTQNMPEFFALRSLDGEIILERDESVKGWTITNRRGPHPWLKEHVGEDIVPAWRENVDFGEYYAPRPDLAVITAPESRWDNFYLEGLDYLVRKYGIDGVYIDDTALTGEAMQRARRILDRDGKRRLADQHSWTHHNPLAGGNSSNLAYIDLYPYFDLLWRGEGFRNDTPAGFWLVERSGIPFGLPGEMLGCGDPLKGLVFGMTDRLGWGSRKGSPQCTWKFIDKTGLGEMEFTGWWDDACPVRTAGDGEIKASVWRSGGKCVLVAANFAKEPRKAKFVFDGSLAGGKWTRPEIATVQKRGAAPDFTKPVELPAGGGLVAIGNQDCGNRIPEGIYNEGDVDE